MLVLVATMETQGETDGDYSFTVEGELVTALTDECDSPETCGCGVGFPGVASGLPTTTAMVVDRDHLDPVAFRTALRDSLEREGWHMVLRTAQFERYVDEHAALIDQICQAFGEGSIVRRHGDQFRSFPVGEAA